MDRFIQLFSDIMLEFHVEHLALIAMALCKHVTDGHAEVLTLVKTS
jgi:hypothetical protein